MKRRIMAICVTLAIMLSFMVAPVSADEPDDGTWVELLATSTVDDSGQNWFSYTTVKNVDIAPPSYMRICKVDMLIQYTAGTKPDKVEFYNMNGWANLTIKEITPGIARVYGSVRQTFYNHVKVRFTRSATTVSYVEILSFKVSRIPAQEFEADATVYFSSDHEDGYFGTGTNISSGWDEYHLPREYTARVEVADWMKYDKLTIWGSVADASIASIRVNLHTMGLPFTVSFFDSETNQMWTLENTRTYTSTTSTSTGTTTGTNTGSTEGYSTASYGKHLYCITVDLSGVDRTVATSPLYVYVTGSYDGFEGMHFNCQYVNGSVEVPDTSEATWWKKFTAFMTGLFAPNSGAADDFQSEAEEQGNQLDEMNDQLQNVTKPPVEDIETDIDDYVNPSDFASVANKFALISNNGLVNQMVMLALTVGLVGFILYGKR